MRRNLMASVLVINSFSIPADVSRMGKKNKDRGLTMKDIMG
jgi:hypothetical protein